MLPHTDACMEFATCCVFSVVAILHRGLVGKNIRMGNESSGGTKAHQQLAEQAGGLRSKYRLGAAIGSGSFGQVFEVNLKTVLKGGNAQG